MNKLCLLFSLIILSSNAIAVSGGSESHGGNVIACYNESLYLQNNRINPKAKVINSPELYDYWEHSQLSFYKLDLPNGKAQDIVSKTLQRLAAIDQSLGENLLNRFSKFNKLFKFVQHSVFPEIKDFKPELLPNEGHFCYKRQAAFQKTAPRFGEGKFFIDAYLYEKMSEKNKAGLILHELIYEYSLNVNNSKRELKADRTRYFNFLISSDFMKEDYLALNYFQVLSNTQLASSKLYTRKDSVTYVRSNFQALKIDFGFLQGRQGDVKEKMYIEVHEDGIFKFSNKTINVKKGDSLYIDFPKNIVHFHNHTQIPDAY